MTTRYVHRENGVITYAGEFQEGYSEEELDTATSEELDAFLNPPPIPAQVLAAKLADGITLTSTGTPAVNGTYAYDDRTQRDLAGIAASIGLSAVGGGTPVFPDGSTSGYQYPQQGGQSVTTFASIAAFQTFYAPYARLLQALQQQGSILEAGGEPDWPSQSVTVA